MKHWLINCPEHRSRSFTFLQFSIFRRIYKNVTGQLAIITGIWRVLILGPVCVCVGLCIHLYNLFWLFQYVENFAHDVILTIST